MGVRWEWRLMGEEKERNFHSPPDFLSLQNVVFKGNPLFILKENKNSTFAFLLGLEISRIWRWKQKKHLFVTDHLLYSSKSLNLIVLLIWTSENRMSQVLFLNPKMLAAKLFLFYLALKHREDNIKELMQWMYGTNIVQNLEWVPSSSW